MTIHKRLLFGFILALTLAACGGNVVPTPTIPPRPTATRISIPLPYPPTDIPVGFSADNPLQLVIVPADSDTAADLVDELQTQLEERTGLALEVMLVNTEGEALAAACDSAHVSVVWVNGLTYAAALARNCGVPALQIQRGTGRDAETGATGVFLLNAEIAGDADIAEVVPDNTFCRTTYSDLFSWVVPTLMMRADGVNMADLTDVDELEDYAALIAGVRAGSCGAVGVPELVWDAAVEADKAANTPSAEATEEEGVTPEPPPPTLEDLVIVAETSPEIPYNLLVVPFAASLDAINKLTDALLTMDVLFGEAEPPATPEPEEAEATAEATEEGEATPEATPEVNPLDESELDGKLAAFFGEGVFIRVENSDFADFNDFLQASGLDFGRLGD